MNAIDLTPLYRSTIGFDGLTSLFESALSTDSSVNYPPYNIEVHDENRYAITLAVAGFEESNLDISVENGLLTVRGKKENEDTRRYLHQGIANRAFERKFSLADHVEVIDAEFTNGQLTINLIKEIPDAMKPKSITINQSKNVIEHKSENKETNKAMKAA